MICLLPPPPAPWLGGQLPLLPSPPPPLPPALLSGESSRAALPYCLPRPVIREGTSRRHSADMVGAGAGLTNLTSDPTPCRELCQAACR